MDQVRFSAVFGKAIERSITLSLERLSHRGYRMTAVTDALWASHIHEFARQRNVEGASRPSVKRFWSEVGGLNNIAESLSAQGHGVTPYKAKKMLKRMEHTPFEEFDGDYHDYLLWATDPKAYEHDLRLRKAATRPRRPPDPFFSALN